MRKLVTMGLTSGKVFGFQILEENVQATIAILKPEDSDEGYELVSVVDLMIKDMDPPDHMFIRPNDIEMLSIGNVPEEPAPPRAGIVQPGM